MATVFKKTITRALPANAELFAKATKDGSTEFARWKDRQGKLQTAEACYTSEGVVRIRVKSKTYTAQYRDGEGIVREVPTGCRDKSAAMSVLQELTNRAEKVRSGIITPEESRTIDHQSTPLSVHITEYIKWLRNQPGKGKRKRVSPTHVANVETALNRIVTDCNFRALRDINKARVQQWVTDCLDQQEARLADRTVNAHVAAVRAFGSWCVKSHRSTHNPLQGFAMLDEADHQKRPRRSLNQDEVTRLLKVTRLRPVAEYGRLSIRRNEDEAPQGRRTWKKESLSIDNIDDAYLRGLAALEDSPNRREELDRAGREREILYKMFVLTGLRKGELKSITLADLSLDTTPPVVRIDIENEKAGKGATIPLRADLADQLRSWVGELRSVPAARDATSGKNDGGAAERQLAQPLLNVPTGLIRIFDKDLAVAGIKKVDERGWSADVHSLRHTFGTFLSVSGVAPRVAQEAMRHSDIQLTMKHYTDPKLLDVAGAIDRLPPMSSTLVGVLPNAVTVTEGLSRTVAPIVALTPVQACQNTSLPVHSLNDGQGSETDENTAKSSLSAAFSQERVKGFEPSTGSLGSCHSTN